MTTGPDNEIIQEIDCIEAIDQLYAYLDGEINNSVTIEKVERHIRHCDSCFTRSQLENELTKRIKKAAEKQVPESFKNRLHKLMDSF